MFKIVIIFDLKQFPSQIFKFKSFFVFFPPSILAHTLQKFFLIPCECLDSFLKSRIWLIQPLYHVFVDFRYGHLVHVIAREARISQPIRLIVHLELIILNIVFHGAHHFQYLIDICLLLILQIGRLHPGRQFLIYLISRLTIESLVRIGGTLHQTSVSQIITRGVLPRPTYFGLLLTLVIYCCRCLSPGNWQRMRCFFKTAGTFKTFRPKFSEKGFWLILLTF